MQHPIVVTGANRRAGLALCQALQANGYAVLAVYRDQPGELINLPKVQLYQADICQKDERDRLIEHLQCFNAIRGIIHNASLWLDDSLENLQHLLRLHVEAPYELNIALEQQLKAAGRADIIHIGDDTALRGTANHIAYAASKAALFNMMLSFAEKYAPSIRVNSISPGLLQLKEDSDDAYREKTLKKALLGFEPGNEPLVEAALYLLKSSFSTGSNLVINGGRHLRRPS